MRPKQTGKRGGVRHPGLKQSSPKPTARAQILQLKRLYATLSQINQTIVRVKNQHELFKSICKVTVGVGEFPLAWIGLLDHDNGEMRPVAVHACGQNQLPFESINSKEVPFKEGLIGLSMPSGWKEAIHKINHRHERGGKWNVR